MQHFSIFCLYLDKCSYHYPSSLLSIQLLYDWEYRKTIDRQINSVTPTNRWLNSSWAASDNYKATKKSFCPNDVILWRHMTAWCQAVTSYDVLTLHRAIVLYHAIQIRKEPVRLPKNQIFSSEDLDLWPMTLTIKLDLHVKFLGHTSNGSAVRVLNYRYTQIYTHTDGTDSITLTADAGGNN